MAPLTEQEPVCLPVGIGPVGEVVVALAVVVEALVVVVVVEAWMVVVVVDVGGVTEPLLIGKKYIRGFERSR